MEKEINKSVKDIVWALRRIVSIVYHESRVMIKKYDITGPQSLVLRSLYYAQGPLTSAQLSRNLNVTPANMTGIIDRLVEKNLVSRTKKIADRRSTPIELTEQGYKFTETLPDLVERKLQHGLEDLDDEQIQSVYSALNRIIKIIEIDED